MEPTNVKKLKLEESNPLESSKDPIAASTKKKTQIKLQKPSPDAPENSWKYGNMDKYYQYRKDDPRINYFQKEWFVNRTVLDIGCNTGVLTLRFSQKFSVLKTIGVDIDPNLIERANAQKERLNEKFGFDSAKKTEQQDTENKNDDQQKKDEKTRNEKDEKTRNEKDEKTRNEKDEKTRNEKDEKTRRNEKDEKTRRNEKDEKTRNEKAPAELKPKKKFLHFPVSCQYLYGPLRKRYPENVEFEAGNILAEDSILVKRRFDTICCFSVTKWIHIHEGDEGVKKLFSKISDSLLPGGIFVLEPQTMYRTALEKKKKSFSEDQIQIFRERIEKIQLQPTEFPKYIQEKLKMKLLHHFLPKELSDKSSFKRPIYVFQKD